MKKSLVSVHLELGYVTCTATYDGKLEHGVATTHTTPDPMSLALRIVDDGLIGGWNMSMEVFS